MKYPRIAHVKNSSLTDPDDFFTDITIFGREWIIEEKLDGSQTGIQFIDGSPDVRNRNTDILHGGSDRQYHPFPAWFNARYEAMWNLLGNDLILFGEWMFHVHTKHYTKLPDWFIAFDMLDKATGEFLPFDDAVQKVTGTGLHFVPVLGKVVLRDEKQLRSFIATSRFGDEEMEGVVLHSADGKDRVKFVTEKFSKAISESQVHWRWNANRQRNLLYKNEYKKL